MVDCELLIANVFKRRPLWDRREKLYSNRSNTDLLWREIAAEMQEDEIKLRKKWRYLRDNFAAELSKQLAHANNHKGDPQEDGKARPYKSKWAYYKQLMFLKHFTSGRGRSVQDPYLPEEIEHPNVTVYIDSSQYDDNNQDSNPENDGDSLRDNSFQSTSKQEPHDDLNLSCAEEESTKPVDLHSYAESESEGEMTAVSSSWHLLPPHKKRRREFDESRLAQTQPRSLRSRSDESHDNHYSKLLEIEQKLDYYKRCMNKMEQTMDSDVSDHDLMFLKSLLPHIKKIPDSRKLRFRSEVQKVLEEFAYPENERSNLEPPCPGGLVVSNTGRNCKSCFRVFPPSQSCSPSSNPSSANVVELSNTSEQQQS